MFRFQIMHLTSVNTTKGHLRRNAKCIRGDKENREKEGKDWRLHGVALPKIVANGIAKCNR
jgi:hypothetical protein